MCRRVIFFAVCVVLLSCDSREGKNTYRILGNIEDPQNKIASVIADLINEQPGDSAIVVPGFGTQANVESLQQGNDDLAIIDNFATGNDRIAAVAPLYPQVLHILVKDDLRPASLRDLLLSGKVFPGIDGSGSMKFVEMLMSDFDLDTVQVQLLSIEDLFMADVVFSFTDLLTQNELRDLAGYQFYSMDDVANVGRGSTAEGFCLRHPEFQPFVIAKEIYGTYTAEPILTIKLDAVLACRADLPESSVYDLMTMLEINAQAIRSINPLLSNFSVDSRARQTSLAIHPGAQAFMNRSEPSLIERHADLLSVLISILVALGSGAYTFRQWQKTRKKNKIDEYYKILVAIRDQISATSTTDELIELEIKLKDVQDETIHLMVDEKLRADESFIIFINLSKIVMDEVRQKIEQSKAVI